MSKDTKSILERRDALISELGEEPRLRTGAKAGLTIGVIPIACLTPIQIIKPDPIPWVIIGGIGGF